MVPLSQNAAIVRLPESSLLLNGKSAKVLLGRVVSCIAPNLGWFRRKVVISLLVEMQQASAD